MGAFDGLDQAFASQLQALIAASGGLLRPGSGRRTIEEQIQLRRTNGCPDIWTSPASSCRVPTAIPGRSNHNHGFAMDLVDASTGRAVQAGSAADRWLRDNAGSFGMHRPVKGEAWHIEPVDSEGMREAQSRGAVGFNMNWMDEPGNPEDELASRLRTVMGMLVGDHPEGDAASLTEQTAAPVPESMPETDVFEGGQKTMRAGATTPASGDRLGNARLIAQIGREMGAPDDAIKIALATALVESDLQNVNHGDRDSLGLFQQRPSQGWGTAQQVMDPSYAARQFFTRLLRSNWQRMNPGAAAQAVQRSAYPQRYGERYGEAMAIFNQLGDF